MKRAGKAAGATAWQRAEAWGVDMAMLERNLFRTPAELVRRHNHVLETVMALRKAGTPRDQEAVLQLAAIREKKRRTGRTRNA